jgi:hypothetical protein
MCFHFAAETKDLKNLEVQSYLYFFLTDKQPNETDGYIKFGITEQDIADRLRQYNDIKPTNIYYISTDKIELRENIILDIYRLANSNLGCHIWHHKKREYYRGDLSLLKRIFFYIASMDSSLLEECSSISDIDVIISKLKQLDKYDIKYYSHPIIYTKDIDITEYDEGKEPKREESDSCERCGKTFKGKRGLTMHMKVCDGVKNLECEYCHRDFSSIYSLSIHMTRCSGSLKHQQEQDKLAKSELQKLQEKLNEIELKHEQDCKKLILKHQEELNQLLIENKRLKDQLEHSIPKNEIINTHMSVLWNKCSKMLASQMQELINETIQEINK